MKELINKDQRRGVSKELKLTLHPIMEEACNKFIHDQRNNHHYPESREPIEYEGIINVFRKRPAEIIRKRDFIPFIKTEKPELMSKVVSDKLAKMNDRLENFDLQIVRVKGTGMNAEYRLIHEEKYIDSLMAFHKL